jgi:hypothetical protein
MDMRKMMRQAQVVGGKSKPARPIPLVSQVGIQVIPDDGVAILMLGEAGVSLVGTALDHEDCRKIGTQLLGLADTMPMPIKAEEPEQGDTDEPRIV